MKKLTYSSLALVLLSCVGHFYLAQRSYQLTAGSAQASPICNINENINCDQVLLSPYAKVFDMSISNFGFSAHLLLSLLLITFLLLGLSRFLQNISFYLSSWIVLSSLVMIVISLTQSLYCPICWTLYLLSFLTWTGLFFLFKPELLSPWTFLKKAFTEQSSYLTAGALLLVGVFLHASFVNSYDLKDKKEILNSIFIDWLQEPVTTWEVAPLIQKPAQKQPAKMLVVEFVDFLCPNCKRVQPVIKTFLERYPDVSFHFYAYPLDGTCNSNIPSKGSGLSCQLSKSMICAGETAWELHDLIFEKQRDFISSRGNKEKIQSLIDELLSQLLIDKEAFQACMEEEATEEKLQQSIKAGEEIGLIGTPTFLINGKRIRNHSEKLLILDRIYQQL